MLGPSPAGASAAPGPVGAAYCRRAAPACGRRGRPGSVRHRRPALPLRRRRLLGRGPRHEQAHGHRDGEAEGEAADDVGRPVRADVDPRDGHCQREHDCGRDRGPAPAGGPGYDRQSGRDGRGRRSVAARECRAGHRHKRVRGPRPLEDLLEDRVEDQRHGDGGAQVDGLHHPAGPPEAAESHGADDAQEPPGAEPVQHFGDAGEGPAPVRGEVVRHSRVKPIQSAGAHEDGDDEEDREPREGRDQERPALPPEAESALSTRHRSDCRAPAAALRSG